MPAPDQSERRQATILFADISGFTSLSEKMDPELVTAAMNECFRMLGAIVERNGGFIDKFIGDCVMAVFGAPKAVEDAPRRALLTALEMRESIGESRRTGSARAELGIHIGINTGEVIAGEVGSERKREYTVMGDSVNLASRLKDAAPTGRIYAGPMTWRLTREGFEYAELAPIALKGKENPVPVYELLSRGAGGGRDRMIRSPLVGRQKELDLLELQVLKAITGEGSIVHLVGDAGLGKSRLIAELRGRECMRRVTLLEGRAQSYGENLSYHPVIDLVRNWAGIRVEDGEKEAHRKLESAVQAADPGGAGESLPLIATLMGMRLDGERAARVEGIPADALSRLIFAGARELLCRVARRTPLVIVLEDVHWADESTVDFLEHLYRMVEKERVLFLTVFRPREERGERLTRTAREGYGSRYVEIPLHPLDGEGCARLVAGLLETGGVPEGIVERIAARTGGNPFFIEEIVRSWIDERAVEAGGDGFRVTDRARSIVVPATVNELIMSRFDRLDPRSRDLLRIACVIGRSFFRSILLALVGDTGDVEEKLRGLEEMQILLKGSRLEEVEYLFTHALVQEAIYDSLLLQARKDLHLKVARAIESTFRDRRGEFAGMLAWHYARGEDYDRAEECMVRAGEEALHAAASSEALNYYRDALELYVKKHAGDADPATVAMLETNIARSLYYKGRFAEALPYYDRLQERYGLAVPAGKLSARLSAARGMAKVLSWLRSPLDGGPKPLSAELREGFALTLEKLTLLTYYDPAASVAQSLGASNRLLAYDLRGFEPGLVWLTGAATLFSMTGNSPASGRAIAKLRALIGPETPRAWISLAGAELLHGYIAGDWSKRLDGHDPVVEKLLEKGGFVEVLQALRNECLIRIETGEWSAFQETIGRLEELSERFDSDLGRNARDLVLMRYFVKRRRMKEAFAALPAFLKSSSGGGISKWAVAAVSMFSSRVRLLAGDFNGAVADMGRAREIHAGLVGATGERARRKGLASLGVMATGMALTSAAAMAVEVQRAGATAAGARVGLLPGREHYAYLRQFLSNAEKFAPDLTEALKHLGTYWWLRGSPRRALTYWRRSIREGERLGAKVELAHTFRDAGILLADREPGLEWHRRGAELYAELGMGE